MKKNRSTLITGGAGFIGANLAHRLITQGENVIVFDNLSRSGSEKNLQWLKDTDDSSRLEIKIADIRDQNAIESCLHQVDSVFHFAAQVAVTKSLQNPLEDFDINLRGTLNLLEILRTMKKPPFLLYTSTNKVYGKLETLQIVETNTRYTLSDTYANPGISEKQNLDFHSPYGCSKGGADQYIIDYARTFSIPATVFRMSCIYGPHQFGNEDQGWVAHFLFRVLQNQPLTIYGDGKQVRDILYIDDLLDAFLQARTHAALCSSKAFTIGGGWHCTVSILEFLEQIKSIHGSLPAVQFAPWRLGDQVYYVSDTTSFESTCEWRVKTDIHCGIGKLYKWIKSSLNKKMCTNVGEVVR